MTTRNVFRLLARIRREITTQRTTQAALVRKLGWTNSRLSNLLRGVKPVTVEEATQIARVLNLAVVVELVDPTFVTDATSVERLVQYVRAHPCPVCPRDVDGVQLCSENADCPRYRALGLRE